MLKELRIRNLAVIESVTVGFGPGLNVLTGETGAGKSILIDALTLLLGERVQPGEAVRAGAETASIEGVFAVPKKSAIPDLLREHGFGLEDGHLIIRRELVRGGRGRTFLNDSHVTLGVLERLCESLLEVHGQHEHQTLLRPGRHLDLLDALGGLGILRDRLRQRWDEWQALSAERQRLQEASRDKTTRIERAREQVDEISAARLRPGEEEELREEKRRLVHAERLREGAELACARLYDEAGAAWPRVGQALTALRELARVDPGLLPTVEALDTASVQLDEAVRSLRGYRDAIVFDPPRLEEIERRLDELGRLKRKHGTDDVPALLLLKERLAAEIETLTRSEEETAQLSDRLEKLRVELATRAGDLAGRREQAAGRMETAAAAELAELDLEGAVLRVRMSREPAGPRDLAVGDGGWRLGPRGIDQAEFLFAAVAGEEPQPLARVASGGELSRVMLALKVVLAAADAVPILVFDEVDAGIGGKTADTVGRKLRQVARTRQVLCVTHLPQIAAYADVHLGVVKREEGGRMATSVASLVKAERVREVARMLGGETVTDASLRNALDLINKARGR